MRFGTATILLFPALIAAAPQSEVQPGAVTPSTAGQCSNNAPVQCCDKTKKLDIQAVVALLKDLNLPIPDDLGQSPTGLIPGRPAIPGPDAKDATGAVPAVPATPSTDDAAIGSVPDVPATPDTGNAVTGSVPATPNTGDVSGDLSAGDVSGDFSAGGAGASGAGASGAGAGAGGSTGAGGSAGAGGSRGGRRRGRNGRHGGRPSRHHDDDEDYDDDHHNKAKRALDYGLKLGNTLNLKKLNVLQKIEVLNNAFKILSPVLVGSGCSPIGLTNTCEPSQKSVCCQNNEFNGLVNVGCTPINIDVL